MTAPKRSPSSRRTPSKLAPTTSGVHFLTSRRAVNRLVRDADLRTDDLVVDLGAGQGHVTAPLAATGARVLAVERDAEFVRRLRRRFGDDPEVRVVHDDLRTVVLPRQRFSVVASVPFALSSALLRRLLQPAHTQFEAGELIVEWGFAKRVTATYPRGAEAVWWTARYDVRIARRVAAGSFTPAPAVDAAQLRLRRRPDAGGRRLRALWWLITTAYAHPSAPMRHSLRSMLGRRGTRTLAAHGIPPGGQASSVRPDQWYDLAGRLADDEGVRLPALPRRAHHMGDSNGRR